MIIVKTLVRYSTDEQTIKLTLEEWDGGQFGILTLVLMIILCVCCGVVICTSGVALVRIVLTRRRGTPHYG